MATSKPRVMRPIEFKLDAYRLYATKRAVSAKEAFAISATLHNTTLSGCMIDYASSYMSDDIKNMLRKKLLQGDPVVHAYFEKHKLEKGF